ncbi:MAG: 16S rRNA (uracil(1498)-N(3))-methyltransferase [Oscillospiraceae bacterium]|jgi:16S rRNA (uracil1498-N3)-methyltransferase|nr:16S rRNA (uracil(1498)-N(3))-methyltransferase [Oscillospiraceae bacterium]
MHRFFAAQPCEIGREVALPQDEAQHAARVLRLAPGQAVELLDGQARWAAALTQVSPQGARAIVRALLADGEPRLRLTLCQGLVKGDKMDWIVQKCTELGVHAVQPVRMRRCVAQDGGGRALERWQRIAREAAKQCGRARVPGILPPVDWGGLALLLAQQDVALVPWEGATTGSLARALDETPARLALVIGPEGGMAEEEMAALTARGARTVTLGPRILRAETAAVAAVAAVMTICGDME